MDRKKVKKNNNKSKTQRRGIKTQQANPSSSNITKNLKGFFNKILSPLLGTPQTQVYKGAYDLQKAKLEKMRNKVYKKGEKVPREIAGFGRDLYGDGSGRTFKNGGFTPCKNDFDGKILYEGYESNCSQFRKKYNQKFVEGKGFKPRFVDMEKDFTGNYILKP